jgi:hypothetical protein
MSLRMVYCQRPRWTKRDKRRRGGRFEALQAVAIRYRDKLAKLRSSKEIRKPEMGDREQAV